MNNFRFGKRSLEYLNDPFLHHNIKPFMIDVLKESKYDISIIDGARDKHDQKKMFDKGLSEMDGVNKLSDHQVEKHQDGFARAIDFIPYVKKLDIDIWDVENPIVAFVWSECFRAILRVDRLWKEQKGIDVGLELGWTYNIGRGRDYPHISFLKM